MSDLGRIAELTSKEKDRLIDEVSTAAANAMGRTYPNNSDIDFAIKFLAAWCTMAREVAR